MNKLIPIVFFSIFLNACSFSDYIPEIPKLPSLKIYKADVNQGSELNRFNINQLKINMSKQQVQNLIGSPSIVDPFHNNQWDYVNHSTKGSGEVINYRLILTFKDDKLTHINTDGITSLSQLTDEQKALQNARITKEKAELEAKQELDKP